MPLGALLRNADRICRKQQSLSGFLVRLEGKILSFQLFQRFRKMHTLETGVSSPFNESHIPVVPAVEPCFKFTPAQLNTRLEDPNIAQLVANKTAHREFFYGIEVTAHTNMKTTCIDFNQFLPIMPLFISIVWLTVYSQSLARSNMSDVASIQYASELKTRIPTMPHLTPYRLRGQQLDDFFALNFSNVLIIRGDQVQDEQVYRYAYQVVRHARRLRGDSMSIGVAGYPEGYKSKRNGDHDIDQDTRFLKMKINAGADFIMTQVCFSIDKILSFIRNTRNAGIEAPIILGIMVPHTYSRYQIISRITSVQLPPELMCKLEEIKHDKAKTEAFFVQLVVDIISKVLDSDVGVYGVQFYTLNTFPPVLKVICELRRLGILKDQPPCDAA